MTTLKEFITNNHGYYSRYASDWNLTYNAYIGGVEWRKGTYLKAYKIDLQTTSDSINTYEVDGSGSVVGKHKAKLHHANSLQAAEDGLGSSEGSFYNEKLNNTPLFPYVRLYVSEYNSILFKNAPVRKLYEDDTTQEVIIKEFIDDVDGEGNSINEFWSQVDTLSTVFGIVWVSCYKPIEGDYPLLAIHTPLEVNNWQYTWNQDGKMELSKISIKIGESDGVSVFRVWTKDEVITAYVPEDENMDISVPEGAVYDDGVYYSARPNELGYIPVQPVYQSMKVFNGVGHTPMFDIAQIQRSVYNYNAEIYSAITYGAHPVNIVDENTIRLNNEQIGAEPGTTIKVASESLPGSTPYTFEFKAPPLDSITEIRDLINQMIEKMNTVAMIRSEDLIKASRSGAQIEQYDTKLEAFVKKKATSLENAEFNTWKIWFDWMGMTRIEDFSISYNKAYGNKGIENQLKETTLMLDMAERMKQYYTSQVMATPQTNEVMYPHTMANPETGEQRQAMDEAEHNALMAEGFTEHPEMEESYPETPAYEQQEEFEELIDNIKKKFMLIVNSSYTENSD